VKIVYSDRYHIDIGPHIFPTAKFALVREALLTSGVARPGDFAEPSPVSWEDLGLVHTLGYLEKVRVGGLAPEEIARLEMPWSESMVEGFRMMAGGTLRAAREALRTPAPRPGASPSNRGAAAHLGGGFHHAFPDHGEGFCLFNDVAVAVRVLTTAREIDRVAIVDCDVHHGNGTAAILGHDPAVFTFSIHQQNNYPALKPAGSLDVGMADGAGDAEYLFALERALPRVFETRPDLVFYLAGADPFQDDQLGGLHLTRHGLRRRDRMVLQAARDAGSAVAVVLAGGYARSIEDTIAIHVATIEEAALLHGK
jgi:acetoin utilization deacetylase AcuC-like enzyme